MALSRDGRIGIRGGGQVKITGAVADAAAAEEARATRFGPGPSLSSGG